TTTDLRSVDDFKQLVVRQSGDTLIRLGDVANVVLGAENYDSDVKMSGKRAVFMGVWVLPNANSLDVIDRVRAEIDAIQRDLPTGMQSFIAFDSTRYIKNAIDEVVKTLTETVFI